MEIFTEELSDVKRYLRNQKSVELEDKLEQYNKTINLIKNFVPIDANTKILEIGIGTGWFPIICKRNNINCKGIEISQQLIDYAYKLGEKYGIKPDLEISNIETANIGQSKYDVIVANSTFEHVEDWQEGIKKVYRALKPGGLFYFYSTNRFSITQGEFRFPLYGWLPDKLRYRLRIALQGEDIMKLGIDFNQFTYSQLRQFFKKIGFQEVKDKIEIYDANNLNNPKLWKKMVIITLQKIKPIKSLLLFFSDGTKFVCVK